MLVSTFPINLHLARRAYQAVMRRRPHLRTQACDPKVPPSHEQRVLSRHGRRVARRRVRFHAPPHLASIRWSRSAKVRPLRQIYLQLLLGLDRLCGLQQVSQVPRKRPSVGKQMQGHLALDPGRAMCLRGQ